ncbi:AI-2E family transporter [Yimella radicis]
MLKRLGLSRLGTKLAGPKQKPTRPDEDSGDGTAKVRPRILGERVAAGSKVAKARTTNEGVDRAMVIGRGMRWTAGWALRTLLILAALWAVLKIVGIFWSALLPVCLALVIATVLWPPTRWLRSRGFSPAAAAVTSLLGAIAVFAAIIALMTPMVSSQVPELTSKSIDGVNKIQDWLEGPPFNVQPEQIDNAVKAITDKLQTSGDKIASGVFTGVTTAGHILVNLIVALILCFLMIKDGPHFLPWLRSIAGRGAGAHFTEMLTRVWQTLSGFIRTQALVSAVDAFFIGLGLVVLGVPLALPLALLTFFGGFVPIVGAFVAGTLAVLVALVTKSVTTALLVLLIVLLVQQLEGHILQPLLQSRSMELHPALVLLSIALGGQLFGIVGAFFAVPLAATVAVTLRYLGEQIDLRTGDLSPDELEPLTPEGRYAAEQAAKDTHPPAKDDLADKLDEV